MNRLVGFWPLSRLAMRLVMESRIPDDNCDSETEFQKSSVANKSNRFRLLSFTALCAVRQASSVSSLINLSRNRSQQRRCKTQRATIHYMHP